MLDKRAFMDGYMAKRGADGGAMKIIGDSLKAVKDSDLLPVAVVPSAIGYGGGVIHSKLGSPSARSSDEAQVALLNSQIEKALDAMDTRDALRRMKDNGEPGGKTIRF